MFNLQAPGGLLIHIVHLQWRALLMFVNYSDISTE